MIIDIPLNKLYRDVALTHDDLSLRSATPVDGWTGAMPSMDDDGPFGTGHDPKFMTHCGLPGCQIGRTSPPAYCEIGTAQHCPSCTAFRLSCGIRKIKEGGQQVLNSVLLATGSLFVATGQCVIGIGKVISGIGMLIKDRRAR